MLSSVRCIVLAALATTTAAASEVAPGQYDAPEVLLQLERAADAWTGTLRFSPGQGPDTKEHAVRATLSADGALRGTFGDRPLEARAAGQQGLRLVVEGRELLLARKPDAVTGVNAALGQVLGRARAAGTLGRLAPRVRFRSEEGLMTVTTQVTDEAITVEARTLTTTGDLWFVACSYALDGRLLHVTQGKGDREDPGYDDHGVRRVLPEGRMENTTTASGGKSWPEWDDRAVPFPLAVFVLPALLDALPPEGLLFNTINEDAFQPWAVFRLTPAPDGKAEAQLTGRKLRGRTLRVVVRLDGGPRQVLALEQDGMRIESVSDEEAERFVATTPSTQQVRARVNERRARRHLQHLAEAMRSARPLPASEEELRASGAWAPETAHPVFWLKGYRLQLTRSADGERWMAIAAPQEPSVTGTRWYAVNADGVVRESTQPIEGEDSCSLERYPAASHR